ncbi:MAG: hypothetical protein ING44_08020 [Telmatospirillum sp.]|nr:hypothetical protein [Telmatospirillum sp.]
MKKIVSALALGAAAFAAWLAWPTAPKAPSQPPMVLQASFAPAASLVVSKLAFDAKFETDTNRAGEKLGFRSFVTVPVTAQAVLDFAAQPLLATRTGNRLAIVAPLPTLDAAQTAVAIDAARAFPVQRSFWQMLFSNERRVLAEASLAVAGPAAEQAQAHFEANRASVEAAARAALGDLIASVAREAGVPLEGVDVAFRALTPEERAALANAPSLERLLRPGS